MENPRSLKPSFMVNISYMSHDGPPEIVESGGSGICQLATKWGTMTP